MPKEGGLDGSPNGAVATDAGKLPSVVQISSTATTGNSSIGRSNSKGKAGSNSTGSLPKIKASKRVDPAEKFNDLLSTIVRSKASGGALIEDVSRQWSKFSQY